MKTLVAYFSKSGRTKKCAEEIAQILGADTFEIVTEKGYPDSYFKTVAEGKREFASGQRPAIIGDVPAFAEYERVLVGFPVWMGTCPMAVVSLLEQYDWTGKTVYPFCTSGTSGVKKGAADIARYSGADVREGLRVKKVKKDEILKWLGE